MWMSSMFHGCNRLTVTYSRSGATRLEAGAPRLEKVTGETVNINPHFSFGEFGLAGYAHAGFGAGVRLLPRPEGEGFFLRVLTWINTDPVPVTPGVRYRVRLVLRKDTVRNRWGKVLFMDAAFKDVPHSGGIIARQPGPKAARILSSRRRCCLRDAAHSGSGTIRTSSYRVREM